MGDWKGWRSSIEDLSTTAHGISAACGFAAFIPGTQPFTIPCAAVFAVVGTIADVALVAHGDMDRSALGWDALSLVGGFGAWYTTARAAAAGSRWSAILRDPNLRNTGIAGPAQRAMMSAQGLRTNWESITFMGATVDALTSIKRVEDNLLSP